MDFGRLRNGECAGLVFVRAFANHRAGRAVGVGENFEFLRAVPAVAAIGHGHIVARHAGHLMSAHRADVPALRDGGEQQHRDGKQLQSTRPLREPVARRKKNHVSVQCGFNRRTEQVPGVIGLVIAGNLFRVFGERKRALKSGVRPSDINFPPAIYDFVPRSPIIQWPDHRRRADAVEAGGGFQFPDSRW